MVVDESSGCEIAAADPDDFPSILVEQVKFGMKYTIRGVGRDPKISLSVQSVERVWVGAIAR